MAPTLVGVLGSVTDVRADAVVNAANEQLWEGRGVCGAIFNAAGADELAAACASLGGCATGAAVSTPAFRLPARHIIHAVGPIVEGDAPSAHEHALLVACYRAVLREADALGAHSVVTPVVSSGIYGYPLVDAIRVCVDTLHNTETRVRTVIIAVIDRRAFRVLTRAIDAVERAPPTGTAMPAPAARDAQQTVVQDVA